MSLVRAFLTWAGWRLVGAIALALSAAMVEGISLLMLVPVIGSLIDGGASDTGLIGTLQRWFIPSGGLDALGPVLAFFAVMIVIRGALLHARNLVLARLEQDFVAEMRQGLFRRLSQVPWQEAAKMAHGRLQHALSRNLDRAAGAVGSLLRAMSAAILLAVQAGIAIWLSPIITFCVAATAWAVLLALAPIRRRASDLGHQMNLEDFNLFCTAQGFLGGLKAAKAHGLEEAYVEHFDRNARGFADQVVAVLRNGSTATILLQTLAALLAIAIVLIGYNLDLAPPETLIVILILMARLSAPLQTLQSASLTLRHGNAAYADALAQIEALPTEETVSAPPLATPPSFTLSSVTCQPDPDGPPLFTGLDARIEAGSVTAITGPSGSGKTTLCDVLAGLDLPAAGEVLMDGRALDGTARTRLSQALAYVGQTPVPLQANLREGLSWGTGPQEDAALWAALATVDAEEMVRNTAGGLDAPLRQEGSHFSGGERQRLALARALLRRPKLMILDEATNALDMAAEEQVLRALFTARAGATVIMVSHRPSTVALADHAITLAAPEPGTQP